MDFSDEKIVSLCKQNNIQGFNSLYSKYEKYIYRLCFYYTNSKEDSLDLLQEIYIKIYRSIGNFDETRPLIPWIKRISINTCQNYLRGERNTTSQVVSVDISETIASNSTEETIDYMNTRTAINDAISLLSPELRSTVVLRHIEGLSYKEISEVTSMPIGTVKTYLFRGRKLIKDYLKKQGIWEV